MGHHYVPQQHLRRFAVDGNPDVIWMYDKQSGRWADAAISKVAQQAGFYAPDVERGLAVAVELPGNIAVDKLMAGDQLTNTERSELAWYMLTMATRGPRVRRESLEKAPELLNDTIEKTRRLILERGGDVEADLAELAAVHERFSKEIPQKVLDQIRTPFWSEGTVECIFSMRWHIIQASSPIHFVTCDTPSHLFESLGVGRDDSEFTFAISKRFALIGEHRGRGGIVLERPQPSAILREINRRVLSHAERFVFSPVKAGWIERVASKPNIHLSQIRWT